MDGQQHPAKAGVKQRHWRNLLLQPVLQTHVGLSVMGLSLVFFVAFSAVVYLGMGRVYEVVLQLTDLPQDIGLIIREHLQQLMVWLLGLVVVYFLAAILLSIYLTHKMVGPTIAFRRHIKALQAGEYKSRVRLRKRDAFSEVADDLNKLAEILEKQK